MTIPLFVEAVVNVQITLLYKQEMKRDSMLSHGFSILTSLTVRYQ